jgi:hypothetical protein
VLGRSYLDYHREKLDAANPHWAKRLIGAYGSVRKHLRLLLRFLALLYGLRARVASISPRQLESRSCALRFRSDLSGKLVQIWKLRLILLAVFGLEKVLYGVLYWLECASDTF